MGLGLLLYSTIYEGFWSVVARDLSFVLIPISLITLIYETVLRAEWVELIKECMEEETFLKAGGKRVYPNFNLSDIEKEIEKATDVDIRIMQSFIPQIQEASSQERWSALIDEALKKMCRFDILLLSPDSPKTSAYIDMRTSHLGKDFTSEEFKRKINRSITFFRERKNKYFFRKDREDKEKRLDSVEIRVFTEYYPIGPIIIVNDTLYHGFFLPKKNALECLFIKVELTKRGMFKEFEEEFENVWKTAKTIV